MFSSNSRSMVENLSVKQFKINYICSCLLFCKIRTSRDLKDKFDYLLARINKNPQIFKPSYSFTKRYDILKKAIETYNSVNGFNININILDASMIKIRMAKFTNPKNVNSKKLKKLRIIETSDDLSKVTKNYDRLSATHSKKKVVNASILSIMKSEEFVVCPHVIIGAGDTGTTVWLERFKPYHGKTQESLSQNKLPLVLMIADGSGSWKHNYTLAQPHSTLERTTSTANPSDYISSSYYLKNPYANGRHVYQANQVSLVKTQAPLLQATVLKIEKKNNHIADWKSHENDYRLILSTPDGTKAIYTNDLIVCTGLGPARNAISNSLINETEYNRLNQFDPLKQFTPIVDGNQFILTGTEEKEKEHRTIVVYGGGGTAAACYRKGFFGNDVHTEGRPFNQLTKENSVVWIAKQFNKAGTGKLATTALDSAKARNELFQAELVKIEPQVNGKLLLSFKILDRNLLKPTLTT